MTADWNSDGPACVVVKMFSVEGKQALFDSDPGLERKPGNRQHETISGRSSVRVISPFSELSLLYSDGPLTVRFFRISQIKKSIPMKAKSFKAESCDRVWKSLYPPWRYVVSFG